MNWTKSTQIILVLHRTTSRKEEVAGEATSSLLKDTYIIIHFPQFSPKSTCGLIFQRTAQMHTFLYLRIIILLFHWWT